MSESGYSDQVRPIRRTDVISHATRDEMVLYDPMTDSAVGMNVSAATIWSLCDGSRSIGEMVSELAALVGGRPEDIREDVRRVLGELFESGILSVAPEAPWHGAEAPS